MNEDIEQQKELRIQAQKELKIQECIRKEEDEIVIAIQIALNKTASYGKLEESQFRNLVRVAESTESTEAIKNFLRYQVGRDNKWGRGKESLAETIIKDIDGKLKELARKISKEAKTDEYNSILIQLTRRYLGYGARYLKYKLEGEF
ncbi:hypothetical protein VB834_09880 [Limnoraphis robusta Tam1]|uniref:Uncharacterized protein n=1 Tax=Limnoraphis robusta CCNP1315 TaxID=3110306 RepID=A0ABU5TTM1_9CYAN|nr:hypothetical protein [Limnoraphis robusta]MEA5499055.1 hypothetical protein [Limnoraphis robusta BA-68 BA1]MEA5518037.1 hypothetical protein [Limnoraphis robusta CCNP1315]MEA5539342.1 hypothetical protein [Limnoraphis robusta Tam1]MEA5547820.1 hypothetical protein [Limnoraphis robusta CCNP1324]